MALAAAATLGVAPALASAVVGPAACMPQTLDTGWLGSPLLAPVVVAGLRGRTDAA